jgi:hypothetical protein
MDNAILGKNQEPSWAAFGSLSDGPDPWEPAKVADAEVSPSFDDAPSTEVRTVTSIDKDHRRIETRTTKVSNNGSWLLANNDRRYPGHYRFPTIKTIVKTTTMTERKGNITQDTRDLISSADLMEKPSAPSTQPARLLT